MKLAFMALGVLALAACDRGGQSEQKQSGYGAATQAKTPQGRVPDAKSSPQDRGGSRGTVGLRGDAALYYLYREHLTSDGVGPQGRYYLSKEGRVFYKDAQGKEHTVQPPSDGLRVPRAVAEPFRDIRGYDGQQTGRDLSALAADEQTK
jgi:hypothetical protein